MCKPRNVDNFIECIYNQVIFNVNFDDINVFEVDDNDDNGFWLDDPNPQIFDEMDIDIAESDENFNELDPFSVYNDAPFVFESEPFPEIDYDMLDCELALENIVEHIETILDNKTRCLCSYCL